MKKISLFIILLCFSWAQDVLTKTEAFNYLNELRKNTGMIPLSYNTLLEKSATNHANYIIDTNQTDHYETINTSSYFTGNSPSDRAYYVDYNYSISENLSRGQQNYKASLEGLFSAIYHRLGFLDFSIDEIGIGNNTDTYVYNMGNNQLQTLCNQITATYGYYQICKNQNFLIETQVYDNAIAYNPLRNPYVVLYPYPEQTDIEPAFFEESPDPLPDYSVTGYPVSIQFNPSKVNSVSLNKFILLENNISITNTRLLTEQTDPHGHFKSFDFALFPLERLKWNTLYTVEAHFTIDGIDKNYIWQFRTRKPSTSFYEINSTLNQTLLVKSDVTYQVTFRPQDGNDTIQGYSAQYILNTEPSLWDEDGNTLLLKLNGKENNYLDLTLSNGTTTKFLISSNDNAKDPIFDYPTLLTLKKGWTLASLPVNITLNESNLTTFFPQASVIWKWDGHTWQGWSPKQEITQALTTLQVPTISSLSATEGFWINYDTNITIPFYGENTPLTLSSNFTNSTQGWKLLGSHTLLSRDIILHKNSTIKALWKYVNDTWYYYNPEKPNDTASFSPFTQINSGEGFWIYQ